MVGNILTSNRVEDGYLKLTNREFNLNAPIVFYSNKVQWCTNAIVATDYIDKNIQEFMIALTPIIMFGTFIITFILGFILDKWLKLDLKMKEKKCENCEKAQAYKEKIKAMQELLNEKKADVAQLQSMAIPDAIVEIVPAINKTEQNLEKLRNITDRITSRSNVENIDVQKPTRRKKTINK